MSINYKYLPHSPTDISVEDLCKDINNPQLPAAIIEKLTIEYAEINAEVADPDGIIYIPVLPPFYKKHTTLLSKDGIDQSIKQKARDKELAEQARLAPKPVVENKPVEVKPDPIESDKTDTIEKAGRQKHKSEAEDLFPTKTSGKLHYKLFPYTFARPGETIEAVIRLYNDMNAGNAMLKKLAYEFTINNKDALPPKLGQTVQIPVLLPFVYRHLNEHKIFNDE